MKLIKELDRRGFKKGNNKARWAVFECPYCLVFVEKQKPNGIRDKSCGCAKLWLISETNTGRTFVMAEETKKKIAVFHKGRPKSQAHRKNISISKMGSKNPTWKGDDVGYEALHDWVARRKPKTEFCEHCGKAPPYDLANISQEYKRDVNDFEWICRKCHMISDGRMEMIKTINLKEV
ncbi:MAG: hypothetical protein E3J94_07200 [Desulfobacteraceae bacterium]|nr:MAG: hypothetical protein E3J94_07200 [Desulfobacteraceae bacterium]